MSEWLSIEQLTYVVGDKPILQELSFGLEKGEYLAVIGANGAGKTTLIKCLAGLLTDWTGKIVFDEENLRALSSAALARKIGYVPQADGRISPFSVAEFVMMSRYAYYRHRNPDASDHQAVATALVDMGLTKFRDRVVGTLSGGERQLVYIAGALAQNPCLLILDEPVTFLDYKHAMLVHERLQHIHTNRQVAILSILHDVNDAARYGDTILALKNGKKIYHGASKPLLQDVDTLQRIYDLSFECRFDSFDGLPHVFPQSRKNK